MKKTNATYVVALAVALVFAGCSKQSDSPSQSATPQSGKAITDKGDQEFIDETIEKLPSIAIYNENIDQYVLLDLSQAKNGFNFASPSGGFSFSSPSGTIQFVEGPDGGLFQIVTPGSSSGGSGGVVTAGDVTLNVNYVFCFNSGDETDGVDFFGAGDGFTGFSGAIGIAGDFEALANMSQGEIEESDPFEFFQGFVEYLAFDGTANGSYEVISFLDAGTETEDYLDGKGLAILFSFQDEGGIFFSVDGEVSFSGNQVSFNGTYWGLTDFLIGFGEDFEPDDDPDYEEVMGFGVLTCL